MGLIEGESRIIIGDEFAKGSLLEILYMSKEKSAANYNRGSSAKPYAYDSYLRELFELVDLRREECRLRDA